MQQTMKAKHYNKELLASLRAKLPEYADKVGFFLTPSGTRLVGWCLMHDDNTPSFAIFGDNHDRCGCYPCDFQGDVFDLSIALDRATNFPEAVKDVAEVLDIPLPRLCITRRSVKGTKRSNRTAQPEVPASKIRVELSDEQSETLLASRLAFRMFVPTDAELRDYVADLFSIPLPSLLRSARGRSGLGIYYGDLAYVYPTGLKVRNPPGSNARFRWAFGKALAPWRFERVTQGTKAIYLTEGESDALALLACGIESSRDAVVVASPGTSFPAHWAPMFAGKTVILCFDFDEPGQRAALQVAQLLSPHATSIRIVTQPPQFSIS